MNPTRVSSFLLFFILLFTGGLSYAQTIKFIPNKGQWQQNFQYKSILAGGNIYIAKGKIYYHFADMKKLSEATHAHIADQQIIVKRHALELEWLKSNKNCSITSLEAFPEKYNYYLGKNPKNWKTGLSAYSKLRVKQLYKNIDVLIESHDNALKYTYYVAPGADASQILLQIKGADKLYVKENGNLYIGTSVNALEEQAPVTYQIINGKRKEVKSSFVLEGNVLSFSFPQGYDKTRELIIDPSVIFATFSGSTADNWGFTATFDNDGNAYSGGTVYDLGFPVQVGSFQDTFAGGVFMNGQVGDLERDASILKFSPDGKKLLWSTYLGGTHNEQPHSMVVDHDNNLVVMGATYSEDFPVTATAYDTSFNGIADIYVCKFNTDGTKLLASTFIGGSKEDGLNGIIKTGQRNPNPLGYNYGDNYRGDIIVDSFNNIYIGSSTISSDFPTTLNAAQTDTGGKQDGVIIKFTADITKIIWSTFSGGSKEDAVYSLQLDTANNVFACGGTVSPYFFNDTAAYQNKLSGTAVDGYILHLKNDGSNFLNSTYIGTLAYDQTYFVQLDLMQNVYVYGQTRSTQFPIVNANYVNTGSGQFISKFNYTLDTLLISMVFGSGRSTPDISPTAFLVDYCGRVYISGWGGEVNAPNLGSGGSTKGMKITPDAIQKITDGSDFYLATFAADLDTLLYASFFGGSVSEEHVDGGTSRFDKHGIVYQSVCGGCGGNSDFPTTTSTWSRINRSNNCNNLVFKVNLQTRDIKADFENIVPGCAPYQVKFKNKSIRTKSWLWSFGDGDSATSYEPLHTFDSPGVYNVKLIGYNPFSCSYNDTVTKQIQVYKKSEAIFTGKQQSCANIVDFEVPGYGSSFVWDFGDSTPLVKDTGHKISHIYGTPGKYLVKLKADTGTLCSDSFSIYVTVTYPFANFTYENDKCKPIYKFKNTSALAQKYLWKFGNGDVSTQQNPTYTYKKPGKYEVTLFATDSNNCVDSFTVNLNVGDTARALFNVIKEDCKHRIILQNNSTLANNSYWQFGDGTTSTLHSPIHIYSKPGKYLVKLEINRNLTCPDTFSTFIDIKFPDAAFTHEFVECEPVVKFTNTSTFAKNYQWHFGEGTKSSDKDPIHRYVSAGLYFIKLVVTDSAGCTDSAFAEIRVDDTVAAIFEIENDTCSGIVRFINKSRLATSYLWKFGNGDTSTQKDPVYDYPEKNKTYTVTLIINPQSGCMDSFKLDVKPLEPPKSAFAFLKDSCTTMVKFFSQSTRAGTYLWNFGDGDSSREQNPEHIYGGKGKYLVSLIINEGSGCADTFTTELFMPRDSIQKPFIPNIITPNGDGENDVLNVQLLAPCMEYEIKIYNRWGQIIYERKSNVLFWDGKTPAGKLVADGTYFYTFYSDIFGEQHGTITVIR